MQKVVTQECIKYGIFDEENRNNLSGIQINVDIDMKKEINKEAAIEKENKHNEPWPRKKLMSMSIGYAEMGQTIRNYALLSDKDDT